MLCLGPIELCCVHQLTNSDRRFIANLANGDGVKGGRQRGFVISKAKWNQTTREYIWDIYIYILLYLCIVYIYLLHLTKQNERYKNIFNSIWDPRHRASSFSS